MAIINGVIVKRCIMCSSLFLLFSLIPAHLYPQTPDELFDKGSKELEAKDFNAALDDFNHTIALAPDYPDAYYMRGLVYYDMKQYGDAVSDFSKAIELNPILQTHILKEARLILK